MVTRSLLATILLVFSPVPSIAQNYSQNIITTVAGRDWIFPPQGGPAPSAPLGTVTSVALDAAGNLYIADPQNNVVFKVDSSGNISTFAGNGIQGLSGEGGPASNASLSNPSGIVFDKAGNLLITDAGNERIRKVATDGTISTLAGTGQAGFAGDGGPALRAQMQSPAGIAVDTGGNVYFVDSGNNRVRKIDAGGNISTVAGNGMPATAGDGGPATQASINDPKQVAIDAQGNLYISDFNGPVIRKVSGGTISTFAGRIGLSGYFGDGGPATSARITAPWGLTFDSSGNLLFTDTNNCVVRSVNPAGIISTVAGNGKCGYSGDGGPPSGASFAVPAELVVGPGGTIYLADRGNQRVRAFSLTGSVSTVAGNAAYRVVASGSSPTQTFLFGPQGIAIGAIAHDLLIAESRGNAIRDISVTQTVVKEAGLSLVGGFTPDGLTGANTLLNAPYGVTKGPDGSIYYADTNNNVVRRINTADQTVQTIAGVNGNAGFNGDQQPATSAWLNHPIAVLVDSAGDVFISDTGNNRIRLVDPSGNISTYAGTGAASFSGDGGPANQAAITAPYGMAFSGNSLYFADQGNHRIRQISPSHMIATVAGSGSGGAPDGENGPATSAIVSTPFGLAFDAAGNMFYSEYASHQVRKVDTHGIVTTIAGNGRPGLAGDGGLAYLALLNQPAGLAFDPNSGYLNIADSGNDRVRAIIPVQAALNTSVSTISLTASGGVTNNQEQLVLVSATLNGAPLTGLGYTTSASSDATWIVVTPSTGTLPQTLLISANASSLGPGSYVGTVTVNAPGANPPFASVAVSVTVGPTVPAQLTANTTQLSQSVAQGAAPFSSNISLANTGSGTINFTAVAQTSSGGNWLTLGANSGSFSNASAYSLVVNSDPSSLAPGIYRGTVTVSGSTQQGTPITPVTVPVSLTVSKSAHVIQLSQTALNFVSIATGSSPLPQSFGITNVGQGSMNWTASAVDANGASVPWLTLSASSGTVSTANTAASSLSATVNPLRLSAGDYFAKIQVASDADNSPQTVAVVFRILSSATPTFAEVQPSALVFTGAAGTVPSSQVIRIAAVGPTPGGSISYNSTSLTQDGSAWFVNVPRSNTIQVNQPDRIVVQPDFTLLAPGAYNGSITLSFPDGTTRTVRILSVVTAGSAPQASPGRLFSAAASCSNSVLRVQFSPPQLSGSNSFTAFAGQQNTLSAKVLYDCSGNTFTSQNGQVTVFFKDGEPAQSLSYNASSGSWTAPWSPPDISKSPVSVQVTATGFNGASPAAGQSETFVATLSPGARVPLVKAGGVVSAASFQADVPIGVGGLISIFGQQLEDGTAGQAGNVPLPQSLGGTQVLLENQPMPLVYASNGQINVQVPYETNVNVPQHLVVQRNGAVSGPFSIQVAAVQPAIFLYDANGQGAITNAVTNAVANTANPVTAGDIVLIYCTGLGPTNPQPATGAALTGPAYITNSVSATIGGQPAVLDYAGLTPGLPGLYQINAHIPAGVTGNAVPVIITVGGQQSPPATMAIQ